MSAWTYLHSDGKAAQEIARRRGMKNAIVALARRLAVIMHRSTGLSHRPEFRWTREQAVAGE